MRTFQGIFRNGNLKPIELPENTRLTVALLDKDDLSCKAIAEVGQKGGAFDFLADAREDIYSDADGEAL